MTAFLPTTRVDVLRGSSTNEYGDEVDADTVVASNVPAAVTEGITVTGLSGQVTYQPNSMRAGVVEEFTIRFRPDAGITENDRLLDKRTGAVYQVRAVFSPQAVVGLADQRVIAVRTSSASQPVNG